MNLKIVFHLLMHFSVIGASAQDEVVKAKASDKDQVFTKVEIESGYPGGAKAWQNYLNKNLRYPASTDSLIKVEVSFVVDKHGSLGNFKTSGGTIPFRNEAERVIKFSGEWRPATQCGRQVNAYRTVSILFLPDQTSH